MMNSYNSPRTSTTRGPPSREGQHSGKWTLEEKQYSDALAAEFQLGTLHIEEGISLRRFLANALHCSAKRISKKYEGSNYNGKLLYKKNARSIPAEEAKEREEKLKELQHNYKESLKVLKMVEDSKQRPHTPATPSHELVHGFLLSSGDSVESNTMSFPSFASATAAGCNDLEASLVATRSQPSLSLQGFLAKSTSVAVPKFPISNTQGVAFRIVDQALSRIRNEHGQHRHLGSSVGSSESAMLRKLRPGGYTSLPALQEENSRRLGLLTGRSSSPSYSPGMLLPGSIAALGSHAGTLGRKENPVTKKAKENALILQALMTRNGISVAHQESIPSGKKRSSEDLLVNRSTAMASNKFQRLA